AVRCPCGGVRRRCRRSARCSRGPIYGSPRARAGTGAPVRVRGVRYRASRAGGWQPSLCSTPYDAALELFEAAGDGEADFLALLLAAPDPEILVDHGDHVLLAHDDQLLVGDVAAGVLAEPDEVADAEDLAVLAGGDDDA